MLTRVAFGYRWGNVRTEGEYVYRTTTYDDRSSAWVGDRVSLTKVDQEIEIAESGVDDLLAHHVFSNLYYEVGSDARFTPYLGVGGGVARVSLDYFSRWKRNDDPEVITTFADRDLNEKLAGTTTLGVAKLSDTVFGYQVLAGVAYQVRDPLTVGFTVRWADFGEFEDGRAWDQLRSHEATVGPGRSSALPRDDEGPLILGAQFHHDVSVLTGDGGRCVPARPSVHADRSQKKGCLDAFPDRAVRGAEESPAGPDRGAGPVAVGRVVWEADPVGRRNALDVHHAAAGVVYFIQRESRVYLTDVVPYAAARPHPDRLTVAPGIQEEFVWRDTPGGAKAYSRLDLRAHFGYGSLLPAFVAIALCWITKEPMTSLLAGIVAGAFLLGRL